MTMNQTFCVLYRAHIDLKKRVKQIGSWREIQTHRFDLGLNHGDGRAFAAKNPYLKMGIL